MLKKLLNIFIIAIAAATAFPSAGRSIKASVDSSQITMGYQTAIRFEIVDKAGSPAEVLVDKNTMPPEVEMIDWVYGDTTDLGNGLVEMKRALIVQSFDSGLDSSFPACQRSRHAAYQASDPESKSRGRQRYGGCQPDCPGNGLRDKVV